MTDLRTESENAAAVTRHGMVIEIPLDHRLEPSANHRDWVVESFLQLLRDFPYFGRHALGDSLSPGNEFPCFGFPTEMVVRTPDLSADFHVWGCEFTPADVVYFFDGAEVQRVSASAMAHGDQNIWLTTIAASMGSTDAVDDARLPSEFTVDWVRFYSKE